MSKDWRSGAAAATCEIQCKHDMATNMPQSVAPKLSICIATYNRASLVGATIESILSQISEDCEVVVSDNASTDGTEAVVATYARDHSNFLYVRQTENRGLDRNFDAAVEHAHGEYCWFMCDDDVLKPGAVAAVLSAIAAGPSLVVVNLERTNLAMTEVLAPSLFGASSDRLYRSDEFDQLFADVGAGIMIISTVVIKRSVWRSRPKEQYHGSLFTHIGVIFQEPLPGDTLLLARPFVTYRDHNARSFWSDLFEILMIRWPAFIWSLAPSATAKMAVTKPEPWRNTKKLLMYRGAGWYSLRDYRIWLRPRTRFARERLTVLLIALLPGMIANTLATMILLVMRPRNKLWLLFLRESHFSWRNLGISAGKASSGSNARCA